MMTKIDTVVIGGGQAGLNTSRALQLADIDHVVLERGRIGETWRSQRWDSFRLNTPSFINGLLGFEAGGDDPDGFMDVDDLCELMEAFVRRYDLPVRELTEVRRVGRRDGGFLVEVGDDRSWLADHVVVCSGAQNVPRMPALAADLGDTTNLHAAEYRNPEQLEAGAVLVVGSAQTGCQIAEELAAAGRTTYLCSGRVASVPRRHRGRDIAGWMLDMGVPHTPVSALDDISARYATQPILSGVDGGHSVSLHSLARAGVTVLGRLVSIDGTHVVIGDELQEWAEAGVTSLAEIRGNIDRYIAENGIDAPAATDDDAMVRAPGMAEMAEIREIDLHERGVTTVIWATGFGGDFSYLDLDLDLEFDEAGVPIHEDGASPVAGLYFVGFPWLRLQSSGLIYGSGLDAEAVVDQIREAAFAVA